MYSIVDFSGRFGGKPFLETVSLSVPNIGKKLTIKVRVDNIQNVYWLYMVHFIVFLFSM